MLIPLDQLIDRYKLAVTGIIHAGAHLAEEAPIYAACGIHKVVWIEADPDIYPQLRDIASCYNGETFCACLSDEDGKIVTFYVTNNNQSSSLLELGTHKQMHPEVVVKTEKQLTTSTLDTLLEGRVIQWNFLNLDLQGAELLALKGARKILDKIDYIYTEVNEAELYKGCALIQDIDRFLTEFRRVETEMTQFHWGDAFYVRESHA